MLIYFTFDTQNRTYNAISDHGECVFYANTIEGFEAWLSVQDVTHANDLTYKYN